MDKEKRRTGSKPNQIYYDLLQSNLENNDSEPILCQFSKQRNQTLIENPQDYKFSIIRFMIETPALPLFRPTIQYTNDPNLTIYSITLKRSIAAPVNGVYNPSQIHQQYIEWTPQDITISTPKLHFLIHLDYKIIQLVIIIVARLSRKSILFHIRCFQANQRAL
jgi:hypothetical protein